MQYVLGNMLNGGGGLNPDGLALDLQFAADKTLTARRGPTPTFTRASSGTFVGSDGLIQTAATNIPRFDHTSAGVCRGLLIEESRTNVALYSGALVTNTGWSGNLTSVASGTGPDGNTAYELAETTTNTIQSVANTGGTSGATQATSVTSGVTYTGSIFVKKVTGSVDWIQITHGGAGFGSSQYANINLSNGTIGNSSGGTARVETYSNGWYRVSWTCAATATVLTNNVIVGCIQNTNGTTRLPSYSGSTSNKFLAAMAQFETGSFATSYIPTTTSALARSADVCSITGAAFTGFYNQLEGSFTTSQVFNAPAAFTQGQAIWDVNDTTANNRTRSVRNATNGFPLLGNTIVGSTDVLLIGSTVMSTGVATKLANGIKKNDFIFYLNNVLQGIDTVATMQATPTTLTIGDVSIGVGIKAPINGTIAYLRYYRKRLPNAKLAQLTV